MRLWRWPFLFAVVYGTLWMHARLNVTSESLQSYDGTEILPVPDIGVPDTPALQKILTEDPRSESSLSYAFAKFGESERAPAQRDPQESDFEAALARVKALRENPSLLQGVVQQELLKLNAEQVVERSILLREAYLAFDHEVSPEMAALLDDERVWAAQNASQISDTGTLKGYLGELTRFSIQNAANTPQRKEILADLINKFSNNPVALSAIRSSILQYAEWDMPELIEGAPASAQSIFKRGSQ